MIVLILPMLILMSGCDGKTHEKVMLDIYEKEGHEKASDYIDSLEDPAERIDLIYVLGAERAGVSIEEFEKILSEYDGEENIHKKVEVVDDVITNDGNSSNILKVTLKNNTGKTLRYVKIDIFYYDDNENLKDTEWANKSGTFLDGGEFIIETYIDLPEGATRYRVEVSEASVK